MSSIIRSTELGLNSFGIEIQSLCLEIVNLMATNLYFEQNPESYLYSALMPFVRQIFDIILSHEIDSDNRTVCCRAVFTLFCVYRARFGDILEMLLDAQPTPQRREFLHKELSNMVRIENLYNNRGSHLQFTTRFERFMANLSSMTY